MYTHMGGFSVPSMLQERAENDVFTHGIQTDDAGPNICETCCVFIYICALQTRSTEHTSNLNTNAHTLIFKMYLNFLRGSLRFLLCVFGFGNSECQIIFKS